MPAGVMKVYLGFARMFPSLSTMPIFTITITDAYFISTPLDAQNILALKLELKPPEIRTIVFHAACSAYQRDAFYQIDLQSY